MSTGDGDMGEEWQKMVSGEQYDVRPLRLRTTFFPSERGPVYLTGRERKRSLARFMIDD